MMQIYMQAVYYFFYIYLQTYHIHAKLLVTVVTHIIHYFLNNK